MKKFVRNIYMNMVFFLFNNTRPFMENWRLNRQYRRLKKTEGITHDPSVINNGYKERVDRVSLPDGFREKVARLFEDVPKQADTAYQNMPLSSRVLIKEELIGIARELRRSAESLLGSTCRIHWMVVNRLNCGEKLRGDSTFWHSDNCPIGSLKAMVLLTPVSADLGGQFEIMSRTQSRAMQKYGWIPDSLLKSREELDQVVSRRLKESKKFTGSPGDVVWFDNNVLHTGNAPISVARDTLLFQFYPAATDDYLGYLARDEQTLTTAPDSFLN